MSSSTNKNKILPLQFFRRPVLEVAPKMLGTVLAVRTPQGVRRSVITEVEAYDGEQDKACHAWRGRTARTEGLYDNGGVFYIYLVYGMYHMLNIVTGERDYPAAVLIRSTDDISGPGRLTRDLGIDMTAHGRPANKATGIWFEQHATRVPQAAILKLPRVGVDYAEEWAEKPYRFMYDL